MPARPADGEPRSDKDKAAYTKDLHDAWGDCHDTVGATAERKKMYSEQYKESTASPISKFFGGLFKKKP